jgi:hypothetical protein
LVIGFTLSPVIQLYLYGPNLRTWKEFTIGQLLWPWENSFNGLIEGVSELVIFASGALALLSVPAWFAVAKLRRINPAFTRRIVVVILLGYSLFPLGLIISFVSCFRTGCFGSLL